MFFEGIRAARQLMRHAADRLSVLWYLGYDLNEPLPDHSSLTRIRERYGVDIFRRFFEQIVEQCQQAGLVWGRELYIDATKVEANAAMTSVKPRFAVEAHLATLFATAGEEAAEGTDQATSQEVSAHNDAVQSEETQAPMQLPVALSEAMREDLTQTKKERHDWTLQVGGARSHHQHPLVSAHGRLACEHDRSRCLHDCHLSG
jgi:hypothetical protein